MAPLDPQRSRGAFCCLEVLVFLLDQAERISVAYEYEAWGASKKAQHEIVTVFARQLRKAINRQGPHTWPQFWRLFSEVQVNTRQRLHPAPHTPLGHFIPDQSVVDDVHAYWSGRAET
jgi:hypothetical protein